MAFLGPWRRTTKKSLKKMWWGDWSFLKSEQVHKPFLERNFFVWRLISLLAFVIVSCLANGENSTSLSLQSPWKSFSASPLMVRRTNALALRRWVLKRPLMEVTNPSPAPSLGRLRKVIGCWSGCPGWPSLSLKLRSLSGTPDPLGSLWLLALSLNFLPYKNGQRELRTGVEQEKGKWHSNSSNRQIQTIKNPKLTQHKCYLSISKLLNEDRNKKHVRDL